MTSLQIVLSGNSTNFKTEFTPSIHLKKPCEIALINLETYYSIPNIKPGFNEFRLLKEPRAGSWDFKIKTGSYNLTDINREIDAIFEKHGLKDQNNQYPFKIQPNVNTFKTELYIQPDYVVDFTQNSLNRILGFEPEFYKGGNHESPNIVNILPVNSILVNLDIASGSYVKGDKGDTIYSFFPNVNPGHKIIERPPFPVYLPLLLNDIYSVRATLTDQNGGLIDLRKENITMRFHIREIKTN